MTIITGKPNEHIRYYKPQVSLEANIDQNLYPISRVAIARINQYRKAMGLPIWTYDAVLSQMGQKHAAYVVLNCGAKRQYGGHYEIKTYPGYSKEGHEAAQTSGLSGGPDPLYGLETLIAGPYHRLQFTNPKKMRVGVGFKYNPKNHCSSTLFVSRQQLKNSVHNTLFKRFILFPPPGFDDVKTIFRGEWPDPRPIKSMRPTGTIITIQLMKYRDVREYKKTQALVTDSSGNNIAIWVTDPNNPSHKTAPIGMNEKYNKLKTGNPFKTNFHSVFIMPKLPLKPGEEYHIIGKGQVIRNTGRQD